MDADAAMNLVMQADLSVGLILSAGELNAVHPQIGVLPARPVGVFGVDLRQRDEGSSVVRPVDDLRELVNRRLIREHWPTRDELWQHVQRSEWRCAISPGISGQAHRIDFQLDQASHSVERVSEQESSPLDRAEQIREQREGTPFCSIEQQCRTAGLVDPTLNLGDFQVRIDFRIDANQLLRPFKVGDTFLKIAIAHDGIFDF